MTKNEILDNLYEVRVFLLKVINNDTFDIGEDEDALKSIDKLIDNFDLDGEE